MPVVRGSNPTEKSTLSNVITGTERELGILAADLVGYSELIFRDAHLGIEILRKSRAILTETIERHQGLVLQTPGDFLLATFKDSRLLLDTAIAVQDALLKHNKSGEKAGHWKIGLARGHVYSVGSDYYGNAINIAARLQALAGPGEILFSDVVPRLNGLPADVMVDELGLKQLKNIDHAVRVYRATLRDYERFLQASAAKTAVLPPKLLRHLRKPVLKLEQFKALGSQENASLFAAGLIGEVHLILSKLTNSILVVDESARIERPPDYILSGTIQMGGHFLRLMARLTSNADGLTLWAERFDCDLRRPFEMQDQMAREIVAALQLALTEGEQSQLWKRGTASGEAWQAFQIGHDHERRYTRDGHRKAKEYYKSALELDRNYLCAIVALAFCFLDEVRLGWSEDDQAAVAAAEDHYKQASSLVSRHPDVLALLAFLHQFRGRHVEARKAMDEAIDLAPNSPELGAYQGALYDLMGDYNTAVRSYRRSLELTPHAPAWIGANLGLTYLALENAFEAERVCREVTASHPDFARAWIGMVAALVVQGRLDDAKRAAETLLALDPRFTVNDWSRSRPFPDAQKLEAFKKSLKSAGLP